MRREATYLEKVDLNREDAKGAKKDRDGNMKILRSSCLCGEILFSSVKRDTRSV